jgi:hypothetical protein
MRNLSDALGRWHRPRRILVEFASGLQHVFEAPAFLTIFDYRSYFVHYLYLATRDGKSTRPRTRTNLSVRTGYLALMPGVLVGGAENRNRAPPCTTCAHMRVDRSYRPLQMPGICTSGHCWQGG